MHSTKPHPTKSRRRASVLVGAFCGLFASGCNVVAPVPAPPLERFEFSAEKMATGFRLVFYAPAKNDAVAAAAVAFARIDIIEQELSDWRATSEVAALRDACANGPAGPLPISRDLAQVLAVAQRVAAASDGAFDVTIGPLVELWRRARRRDELPGESDLAQARAHVGFRAVELDLERRTVTFKIGGIRLDFGGIAKGFAADEALKILADCGITRAMVAAGGDIAVGDPPPDAEGWKIELAGFEDDADRATPESPLPYWPVPTRLVLTHAAVSTSGDTWRGIEVDGVRYSHIVDPRTGMGLTRRALTSVVAPDGTTADALATALNVLDPQRGIDLIRHFAGSEARIETLEKGQSHSWTSPGFGPMMLRSH